MINLSQPDVGRKEARAVWKVLKSRRICFGPELKKFEEKCAAIAGTAYACAVNSGTSGLHLIVRALGIGENDAIIAPSFTFIASSNCAVFEGAYPIMLDIEDVTYNLDPKVVKAYITENCSFIDTKLIDNKTQKHIKAIVGVDVFGHPCDIDALQEICDQYNLFFIEDAAEAIGSQYKGKSCGGFGAAGIFAFYPNKQITTGEGGVITTNDKELYELVLSMKNQGRSTNMQRLTHDKLGYNYRLSDINAAIGLVQANKLDKIIFDRKRVAGWYDAIFSQYPELVKIPQKLADCTKLSRFVYVVEIQKNISIDKVVTALENKSIQSKNYFSPVHLQSFYQTIFGYKEGDLSVTERIAKRTLSLPFYNKLSRKEVSYIAHTLIAYLQSKS